MQIPGVISGQACKTSKLYASSRDSGPYQLSYGPLMATQEL